MTRSRIISIIAGLLVIALMALVFTQRYRELPTAQNAQTHSTSTENVDAATVDSESELKSDTLRAVSERADGGASAPALTTTIGQRLEVRGASEDELSVTLEPSGAVTGYHTFSFCSSTDARAEAMLDEVCADACQSTTARAALKAELCRTPSFVRQELFNSYFQRDTEQQVGFEARFHEPGEYYVVQLIARAPGTSWIETREPDAQVPLSLVRFPVAPGSVATYLITQAEDGALEMQQVKLDVEGDGTVDFSLSHGGVPPETELSMLAYVLKHVELEPTERAQISNWIEQTEDLFTRKDNAGLLLLRKKLGAYVQEHNKDELTAASAYVASLYGTLEDLGE